MQSVERDAVYTIGHSTHTITRFLELLARHRVTAVVDVRSVPYSRFQSQYNREVLAEVLESHGIVYMFLGKELGGRSEDVACYQNGRVQYRLLARTDAFRAGIDRVRAQRATHYRLALMCAEGEPLECHRALLIGQELDARGIPMLHIRSTGELEPHADAMKRLIELVGLKPTHDRRQLRLEDVGMPGESELIEQACRRQEERVAYVDDQLTHAVDEVGP